MPQSERVKQTRAERRAAGYCDRCVNKAVPGQWYCEKCRYHIYAHRRAKSAKGRAGERKPWEPVNDLPIFRRVAGRPVHLPMTREGALRILGRTA